MSFRVTIEHEPLGTSVIWCPSMLVVLELLGTLGADTVVGIEVVEMERRVVEAEE